jgi:RHS repeat-associated protein
MNYRCPTHCDARQRYAGYYYDISAGLCYFLNRYYDPGLRRFLTIDPAGAPKARTAALNPYAYCENNPLGYADHSGLAVDAVIDLVSLELDADAYLSADPKNRDKEKFWLGVDVLCLATPNLPASAFKGFAKYFANYEDTIRMIENGDDIAAAAGKARPSRPRAQLIERTGVNLPNSRCHHMLPQAQEFRQYFKAAELNINDPRFLAWWEKTSHMQNWYQFNQEWRTFFRNSPNPSADDILGFARKLGKDYGLELGF